MNIKHYPESLPERKIAALTRQLLTLARASDPETAAQIEQDMTAAGLLPESAAGTSDEKRT